MLVESFEENLILGTDSVEEAAEGSPSRHDLIEHATTRIHDKPETDRLVLAGVEVSNRLGHVFFIEDKVLGSQSRDIATIMISDCHCDQLRWSRFSRLRIRRSHTLLCGELRRSRRLRVRREL